MLKKWDFVVFGIIITLAIFLFIAFFGKGGNSVTVTVKGEIYGEYPLNLDNTIKIETEFGVNTLVIEKGEAYFKDSDCPDKTCQKSGKIHTEGGTIVCLPHKVIAEVRE